jgi:hypothetical protein
MSTGSRRAVAAAVAILGILVLVKVCSRLSPAGVRAPLPKESERRLDPPEPPPTASPSEGTVQRPIRTRDPQGAPLRAKIRVSVSKDQFKTFRLVDLETDGNGLSALGVDPEDWVLIDVRSAGFAGVSRPPLTWSDLEQAGLDLALQPAIRVDGATSTVNGAPFAGVRIRFSPVFSPGDFAGQVAARMAIVDEEVTTDSHGGFSCVSLRAADYRLTFPDHPDWPGLNLSSSELAKEKVNLRIPWIVPPAK